MEDKYNELEKLNQLKENGTITDAEFEMQKAKMLNDKSNITRQKSKSKLLKIIIAIVVVIIIIVIGIIIKEPLSDYILVQDTENKIGQINAEELKEELINELKNTPLNINTSEYKTTFETYDMNSSDIKNTLMELGACAIGDTEKKYYNNFIFAYIGNYQNDYAFVFPCFKIESDDNNKVRNIKFVVYDDANIGNTIISKAVYKVLENNYNIKYEGDIEFITHIKEKGASNAEKHITRMSIINDEDIVNKLTEKNITGVGLNIRIFSWEI